MSLAIVATSPELDRLNRRLKAISRTLSYQIVNELLEGVGAIVESQTRRRISVEKTDPKGVKWEEWSEAYAGSKHGRDANHKPHPTSLRRSQGHSLLVLEGDLLDSIQYLITGDEVQVGSNLIYANRQNAQRTFLGLSKDNEKEVVAIVDDFLDKRLNLEGA